MKLAGQKWTLWVRDIVIGGIIIAAVLAWQGRDMLDQDGSVTIPHQVLPTLQGQPSPLLASDTPTLVYFFAPWCQICHLSIGNLEYVNNDNIKIVRVALDYANIEDVQDFATQHEISSPILLGNNQLKQQFNVNVYPTYYLLNAESEIIGGSKGYSTAAGLKLREFLINYE